MKVFSFHEDGMKIYIYSEKSREGWVQGGDNINFD